MNSQSSLLTLLQDTLHSASDVLLYPVLFLLIAGIVVALFEIGTLVVEFTQERRYFQDQTPQMLRSITEVEPELMGSAIVDSGLIKPQQEVLGTLFENRDLPEESRWALAKKLLGKERQRIMSRAGFDEVISKVAPMIGLMGTLIPLGPGLVAFGEGDASVMASAMLVAFSTTVTGLAVAVVTYLIARVRRRWYGQYLASLEAGVTCMLERMDSLSPKGGADA
ncbi:MAG: MotA/TolQ/ExbB proton channel family protein [Coriobacteriia bacterium]|nr:MotA/TolQ/ExbB proton channel family protein [Coriobacteriia bacterium]